ncbi:DoxX family protein [Phreatobacter stygius]|uniref:DoxX family protein n=1 Tax=Phreatobacter stygius TaxID=1940610 RepID=A0A4D7BB56_9HYPH|nr:DoxX family protein [Phreatobacter stygius]QCI67348.1 DoxX family protein [Phreatobacter stygius]
MAPGPHVAGAAGWQAIGRVFYRAGAILRALAPPSLTQLVLRCALAVPFWRSGVNKWDGFLQLNEVAVLLFSSEFQLHLPGGPYSFPAPAVVAFAAGSAEILLPILLVLGLATRPAAFGLLVMTLVVQLTVPQGWPLHVTWAAMALAIMASGPGRISLDHWLDRWIKRRPG